MQTLDQVKLFGCRFLCLINKPNLDCNYTYPSDFAPNKIPFGAKLHGKVQLKYGLIDVEGTSNSQQTEQQGR